MTQRKIEKKGMVLVKTLSFERVTPLSKGNLLTQITENPKEQYASGMAGSQCLDMPTTTAYS